MEKLYFKGEEYEIVKSIPSDYYIWNIGRNMKEGYLPLCKLVKEGGYDIDPNSLKAIKCEGAQEILSVIGFFKGFDINKLSKQFETYIKRNKKSKYDCTLKRVEKVEKALKYFSKVKIGG